MTLALHFPPQQAYDLDTGCVHFPAIGPDGVVQCRVCRDVFETLFGAGHDAHGEDLVGIFLTNRTAILEKARDLFAATRFEPDGTLCLRAEDFGGGSLG